jgi:hypothetical protein
MLIFLFYAIPLLILLKTLGFFRINNFRGWALYGVLLIKLVLAFTLYHFPYDSLKDSQIYLHDSRVLSDVLLHAPQDFFVLFFNLDETQNLDLVYMHDTNYWSHETSGLLSEKRSVIRVNALFQILGFQNPYIVFLWNALVSILGLKLIYKALRKYTTDTKNILFLALFLLPSTLLWTSNLMKESYMLLGLGVFLQGILVANQRKNKIFLIVFGLLILLLFKQYVAIGFLLGFGLYLLLQINKTKYKILALSLCGALFLLLAYMALPKFTERISQKQFDFIRLAEGGIVLNDLGTFYKIDLALENRLDFFIGQDKNNYAKITQALEASQENHGDQPRQVVLEPSEKHWYVVVHSEASGSRIDVTPIQNDSKQLLKNIPEALINVCFRPFPKDPPNSLFKWYFVLENLFLWSLFTVALFRLKKTQNSHFIALLIISSLIIALLIGWTTPVIGAIVRYKLPVVVSLIAVSWLLLFPQTNIISKEKQ